MVQICKVIIRNRSKKTCGFHLFQLQPTYVIDGREVSQVHSCCVGAGEVEPFAQSGAELEFAFKEIVLAGAVQVQDAASELESCRFALAAGHDDYGISELVMQRMVGTQSSADCVSINSTQLSAGPLALSPAVNQSGVTLRSFRVVTPSVSIEELAGVYCGNAIEHADGCVVLSSFVQPVPDSQIDCAPLFAFWLNAGACEIGQAVPYNRSGPASVLIEFAFDGPDVVIADYNEDGTFSPGMSL